ncbi:MAG TPA: M28 family peptidase [Rhodothermales bacterium]
MRFVSRILLLGLLAAPFRVHAQEPVDHAVIDRIREEERTNSRVMDYAFALSECFGPRMTGTPAFREAGEWADSVLTDLGFSVHREPIDWGRGWTVERVSLSILHPQPSILLAHAVPWSPPTDGPVEGTPVLLPLPDWETPAVYRRFFDTWRGRLAGRILLATAEVPQGEAFHNELISRRLSEDELSERIRLQEEAAAAPSEEEESVEYDPETFGSAEFFAWQDSLYRFLKEEGVVAILYGSGGRGGTVHLNGSMRLQPAWLRHSNHELPPPSLVVAAEHYNRLLRLLEAGEELRLQVDVAATFHKEPAFNLVAEIPGAERPGELVMLGAHLDGWPLATAATDNAAGVAVVMEAMRILRSLDLPLRRTVRMVLWGGHEGEGLGSRTYVQRHFDAGYPTTWLEADEEGVTHQPLAAYDSLSAYFNLDYLAGRVRGIFLQANEPTRPIFEAWLAPFEEEGAAHVSGIVGGGSDHMAFEDVGLNGFPFIQDGPMHDVMTHHSNMDVFDYLDESDLRQSAPIVASIVYHAAMRPELLPRKQPPSN